MANFGATFGVLLLGRINVPSPGTPAPLSQNTPLPEGPSAVRFNEMTFKAPGGTSGSGQNIANTGNIYICYKGGNKNTQNSIITDLAPGQGYVLSSAAYNSPLDPNMFVIDADDAGDGCRVSGITS